MSEKGRFIKGTVILIFANAIAKILGAVFKIPITYILKEEGMAVYTTAFSAYTLFLSFATSGFPFSATKLLSEYTAKNNCDRIRPVVRSVGTILFMIGFLASLVMYIFAEQLSILMKEPHAVGAIRVISPSVMLVAVGYIFKSSNEARSNHIPTAFSQVTEAMVKLILGLCIAHRLSVISLYKAAEGAVLSVTLGEAFATALLFIMWKISVSKLPKSHFKKSELVSVFSIAVPMLLTGCAIGLLSIAEVSTIRTALCDLRFTPVSAESFLIKYSSFTDAFDNIQKDLFFSQEGVRKLYGGFSGYAQAVFNLPLGIIATISAAATPMFAKALNIGNSKDVIRASGRVSCIILTLAIPVSLVCLVYSQEVLYLIFGNRFSQNMLSSLAPAIVFISLSNMITAILHLSGIILEPFITISTALILKIFLSAILIRIPSINILGAGIATTISAIFSFVCLLFVFKRNFGEYPEVFKNFLAPFCASLVMIGIIKPFLAYFSSYTSDKIAFIISCLIGFLGYLSVIVLTMSRYGFYTRKKG